MANKRMALAALAISGAVALITYFEGFRSDAYLPTPRDKPTIGYGQTHYSSGKVVKLGDHIDKKTARQELNKLVKSYQADIDKCIKVPLTQNEYNAYLSLAYNIGSKAFCGSSLVRELNKGNYEKACSEIKRWHYQNGKSLPGLVVRREQEYRECVK